MLPDKRVTLTDLRAAYALMGTRPRPSFRRMERRGIFGFTTQQNAEAVATMRESWAECLALVLASKENA